MLTLGGWIWVSDSAPTKVPCCAFASCLKNANFASLLPCRWPIPQGHAYRAYWLICCHDFPLLVLRILGRLVNTNACA